MHEHYRFFVPGAVGALDVVTLAVAVVALGVVAAWGQWLILSFALAAGEANTLRGTSGVLGFRSCCELLLQD